MTDGRSKGNKFENEVCRAISQWLVPDTDWSKVPVRGLPFRRQFTDVTPLTGHWEGEGDILHVPGIMCPFCFETKKQEKWELDGILANAGWPPWGWWEQCVEQANRTDGLWPVLFFSRNRRGIYCMIEEELDACLKVKSSSESVLQVKRPGRNCEVVTVATLEVVVAVSLSRIRRLKSRSPRLRKSSSRNLASRRKKRQRSGGHSTG